MGLQLKNPIVPSASPLSRNLDDIKGLEDAGASAIVMYSLFEEQISLETGDLSHLVSDGAMSLADASVYFPHRHEYPRDPDAYVEHVHKAKEAVSIPIIGSMNGTSVGGWLDYAKKIEQAGADGLELNVYFIPTTDTLFGLDIETLYLDILKSVVDQVNIPVAVKLSPFFSALPNFATRLDEGGADALVLFNRFYVESLRRPSFTPALGCHPLRSGRMLHGPDHWRSYRQGRCQIHYGWRGCCQRMLRPTSRRG
jgi:dihydroorotate dehydrogenase (fumarate)